MSRKKNKERSMNLPVDTGGLNLNLPEVPLTVYADAEPAIDVTVAPESRAHMAMEELESLPPMQAPPEIATVFYPERSFAELSGFPGGLELAEALHLSPFIWMAAARTNIEGCLLLSNGTRHWTVAASNFEPTLFEGVRYDAAAMRNQKVWRPVLGNERGWYVNEIK
jgi:hypothetical protein